jgi:hypothetical protein
MTFINHLIITDDSIFNTYWFLFCVYFFINQKDALINLKTFLKFPRRPGKHFA